MEQAKKRDQKKQAVNTSKIKPSNNTSNSRHPMYKKFKQSPVKKINKRIGNTPFNFKYQHEREESNYERFNEFLEENESKAKRDTHLEKCDSKKSDPKKFVEATTTKLGKACSELGGFKKLGDPFMHRIDYKQYK